MSTHYSPTSRRRAALLARYLDLPSERPWECTYCGDYAPTKDHIPPFALLVARGPETFIDCITVPCCVECNSTLGARELLTLTDRAQFLFDTYIDRYTYTHNLDLLYDLYLRLYQLQETIHAEASMADVLQF